MIPKTLLDVVAERDTLAFDFTYEKPLKSWLHSFSWTIGEALDTTIWGFYRIMNLWVKEVDTNTILRTVLSNARIFRGIALQKWIECRAWWFSKDYVQLIEDYVSCSLELSSFSEWFLDSMTNFSFRLWKILDLEISQKADSESWVAMNPRFSNFSVQDLYYELWEDDYIFIALGNGWIVPWFDVYLKLKGKTWRRGEFYPVRFSRMKSKDNMPQLTLKERVSLTEKTKWKKIIIFDEDASSWNTLIKAEEFFQDQFRDSAWIIKRANIWEFGYNRYS